MGLKGLGIKGSTESPFGLLSSLNIEGNIISRYLKKIKDDKYHGLVIYKGKIQNKSAVYIISGVGKTNASIGATLLIEKFSPHMVINLGVGGAYRLSGLGIGDVAIAEKEIYGDEGVHLRNGFHTLEETGIPLLIKGGKRFFNEFLLDRRLVRKALSMSQKTHHKLSFAVKSGIFLTVSTTTGTMEKAEELEKKFNAICENMEGAAVAHICTLYGIPMLEIRGISNLVGDRNKKEWNIKLASENCQKAVMEFMDYL